MRCVVDSRNLTSPRNVVVTSPKRPFFARFQSSMYFQCVAYIIQAWRQTFAHPEPSLLPRPTAEKSSSPWSIGSRVSSITSWPWHPLLLLLFLPRLQVRLASALIYLSFDRCIDESYLKKNLILILSTLPTRHSRPWFHSSLFPLFQGTPESSLVGGDGPIQRNLLTRGSAIGASRQLGP